MSPDDRASFLHATSIVVDAHNDVPSVLDAHPFDFGKPSPKTHTDLPRMRAGGVGAEIFSIYVAAHYASGGARRRALHLIDLTERTVAANDDLVLARTVDDVRRAKHAGKIAILMGVEGGHAIENSLATLRELFGRGVRYMTLTHTNTNDWADSSGNGGPVPRRHGGLAPFGEEVVREMQRLGMLVDVSHASDETFVDVMRVAAAPVIASHSSMRAICNHSRNLSDEMLRALAKNGGVVMINFWSAYLAPNGRATLATLVDHIDHAVKIAGAAHVGLGSDFDGVPQLPDGMTGIDDLPKITRALVDRGYTDDDIRGILGENFLRVLAAAEVHATGSRSSR